MNFLIFLLVASTSALAQVSDYPYQCVQGLRLMQLTPFPATRHYMATVVGEGYATKDSMADLSAKMEIHEAACEARSQKEEGFTWCSKTRIHCSYVGPDLTDEEIFGFGY